MSKNTWVLSDQAGVRTWVFWVSNGPPSCRGFSWVGLVLPWLWGPETGQEKNKVRRREKRPTCSLDWRLVTSRTPGRWAQNTHAQPQQEPLLGPRVGAEVHWVPGLAHIIHLRLGIQESVRALGHLQALIKPSQPAHKKRLIFDDRSLCR